MRFLKYSFLSMTPFVIGIIIISPFQDVFYGGDGWAYAWSVQNLVIESQLQASDWATAQAVPQILWAAIFVKIFGWSISVLNISTIVAAFFAGLAFFYILVALNFKYRISILTTIVVTVSPIYIGMSMTFMTDSMYTSLILISSAFYVAAILKKKTLFALIGGLFCAAAILNRQFGIVLLIAYAMATLFWYFSSSSTHHKKHVFRIAIAGAILPVLIFGCYLIYPDFFGGKTIAQAYVIDTRESIIRLFGLHLIYIKSSITFTYLIVLLCPIIIPFFFTGRKKLSFLSNNKWLLGIIALLLSAGPAVWFGIFGTVIQGDVFQVNGKYGNKEILSELIFSALFILCLIPGTLLLVKTWKLIQSFFNINGFHGFLKKINTDSYSIAMLFIILFTIGQVFLTSSHLSFYNNYFLPILPFFAICVLLVLRDIGQNIYMSNVMVSIFFLTSILYTESTARFVEASWKEADTLVNSGYKATTIFPWPAWYGWRNIDDVHEFIKNAADDGYSPINVLGIAFNDAQIHVIGSSRHPLYNEVIDRSVTYETLLGTRKLWVYKKID